MMQEDEKRKRRTPASRASSASRTDARWLISSVQPRVEVPDRVVAQSAEMHDGVVAADILELDVTEILGHFRDLDAIRYERALAEVPGVEADDAVSGRDELGGHDRADVTTASGEQDGQIVS